MLKKLPITIALIAIALVSTAVQAQELKIGYINPQQVLERMPEMAAVQMRVKNFRDRKSTELQQKEAAFITAQNDLQAKAGVISETAKATAQENLAKLYEDLQIASEQAQQEINNRTNELLGPLLVQLQTAISTVAKKQGLAYVLNTTTNTGDQIILYVAEDYATKFDITGPVMEELGI